MSAEPAVLFEDVSYTYPGAASPAVERVSLRVEQSERLAVIGPNGGGKSTLLRLMLGLVEPDRGRVTVLGRSAREARREGLIGHVAQRSHAELAFPLSARQVVELAAARSVPGWRMTPPAVRDHVDRCRALVGAGDYARRPIGSLSGGQLQRVLIARALAQRPKILALDEPMVGIDAPGQIRFGALLRDLHRELGLTILLVSHDLRTIAVGTGSHASCDRVACIRRTLHVHAAPGGVTPQVLAEVFQHDLAEVFGEVHVDAHRAADCAHDHSHAHGNAGP